ncbi:MAG TPA: DUF4870 domain-containing protein [Phycisphaerales bacterium]|nr:DUF4870 domain-containing protein [Phycisphaerales bacterium]HIB49750.1 DUF4870 domain-containing protein [Phycisphaerales bacterium]HIN84253.1 DUF4870 domain-containing protein [Phycisphaerales bacterium]HIO19562.1 DUF4870 domain-containing protein [Phycisphaerales bacterium]HIO52098.1 DUF4870 domain-containing protein [Phycisphaerales bacterium]
MANISVPEEQNKSANNQEQNAGLASLAHWSFLIGYVVPFASLIIPLVLYNTTGKEDAFVKANAKEALNLFLFSIIIGIVFAVLILVIIGIPLLGLLGLYLLVFPIIAAVKTMDAKQGAEEFRYPIIFRLLS